MRQSVFVPVGAGFGRPSRRGFCACRRGEFAALPSRERGYAPVGAGSLRHFPPGSAAMRRRHLLS
ncbi:MAG: hypothetical protein RR022_03995, partial [Angelakisella sp.]